MAWNPYTDYQNRGFVHILTTLFPEQTKTLPRILVWSIIFLIDLIAAASCTVHYGLLDWCTNQTGMTLAYGVLFLLVIGVFWLQGWIWGFVARLIGQIRG